MIGYIKENPHCNKCEHCENTHRIKDLNDKLDEYFCTLSCRIAKHISDLDIHVTKEKKAYWDAKAEQSSVDALNDNMENVIDKLELLLDSTIDLDKFVTKDYLSDFVTKDYVNEYVNTVISGYDFATKEYVKTYVDGAFDPTNYYTKFLVDSLLSKNIKDYTITSVDYSDGTLTINLGEVSNSKSVYIGNNSGSGSSSGITQEVFDDMLKASKAIHTLTAKNKVYNPIIADVDITSYLTGSGGSGGSSDGGGYYKPYFKNAEYYDSFPKSEMPTDGLPPSASSGWTELLKNPASGQYTWMTQVFIDSAGDYGSYMDPIRLTGEKGSAGEDGTLYEYIYRRLNQNETLPSKPDNKQQDGYVPSGWNDHPEGVDKDNKYEYVCYRIKNKDTDLWGDWFGPYLWSAFGTNGTDGDGVEYIYYVGFVKPTGKLQDPSQWDTSVEGFLENEYILSGSGWTDDPTDLTEQGQKQYVSVRKKRDNVWLAYSEPALWSYYSVDGKSDSIMMRVDGENQYIPLNSDMTNKQYTVSIPVYMYNNSDTISFDLSLVSAYNSNGVTNSSLVSSISIGDLNSSSRNININIINGLLAFNDVYYTIKFKATSTSGSTYVDRAFEINLFGVNNNVAKDAETYSLKTNSHVIKYEDGAFYPSTLSCYVLKSVGDNLTTINPSSYSSGWTFKYSVDDNTNVTLNSDSITLSNVLSSTSNSIQFVATNGNGITLSENIPVVKSGVPGLNGVSYNIEASNISYTYKPKDDEDAKYDLVFKSDVKLIKRQGSTQEYLNLDGYYLKYSYNSDLEDTGIVDNTSSKSRTISISDTIDISSTVVLIYAYEKGTGAILAQILIPVSAAGKKGAAGDSASLTLVGSPLRMVGSWSKGTKYYDGKRAADTSDGVFYQDVVLYNNVYYACINTETGEIDKWLMSPDKALYFSAFSLTEDLMVNLLIANKAFIKLLSSNEVVIMDDDTIVAGMTSGTKKENSQLDGKIDNIGDVRIWAGKPSSTGDLTTAPFTVTSEGVVTSIGENGTILIKDGTIYFIKGDKIFYLAIVDGKPNWTTGTEVVGSTQYTFYTFNGSDGSILPVSHSLFLSNGDKKYYTSSELTLLFTGEYYKLITGSYNSFIYNIGGNVYLATNSGSTSGLVNMYQKITFKNGTATFGLAYALGKSVSNSTAVVDGGTGMATINTSGYSKLYFNTIDSSDFKINNLAYPGTINKLNLSYTMYNSSNYTLNKETVGTIYYVSTTSTSGTESSKIYTTASLPDINGNISLTNNSTLQIIGDVTLS